MASVSIIVPFYNTEQFAAQCIESVLGQDVRDLEVILVDDGSPDRCGEIIDEYASLDTRVVPIHQPNSGVGAARNAGLRRATGESVLIFDSDDWLPPAAISSLLGCLRTSGADVAVGDYIEVTGEQERRVRIHSSEFLIDQVGGLRRLIAGTVWHTLLPFRYGNRWATSGSIWNKLIRRSVIDRSGTEFDVQLRGTYDDGMFMARIIAAAKSVAYVPEPVYNYRQLADSLSHRYCPDWPARLGLVHASLTELLNEVGDKRMEADDQRGRDLLLEACTCRAAMYFFRGIREYYLDPHFSFGAKEAARELSELAKCYTLIRNANLHNLAPMPKRLRKRALLWLAQHDLAALAILAYRARSRLGK
jgi:glycosyltransferase involved in cell wall biosynthesis